MTLESRHKFFGDTRWKCTDPATRMTPFMAEFWNFILENTRGGVEAVHQIQSIHTAIEDGYECSHCEITIRVTEGLVAVIEYDRNGALEDLLNPEGTDVELVADFVLDVLLHTKLAGEDLIRKTHKERKALRKTFQIWTDKHGVACHLIGSRLQWTEMDRYAGTIPHAISVRALNADLVLEDQEFVLDSCTSETDPAQEVLDQLLTRHARLKELNSQGADGSIDLIAFGALENDGLIGESLRELAANFHTSRHSSVSVNHRHVSIRHTTSTERQISFEGSKIEITGLHLPESTIIRCIGRPVTDIIEHPYLSSSMTVISAENCEWPGQSVRLRIAQPTYYFCSLSGRYWQSR